MKVLYSASKPLDSARKTTRHIPQVDIGQTGRQADVVVFIETINKKKIHFQNYKQLNLIHTWSDKAFKGIVVNQTLSSLHGGSLEITPTVPLITPCLLQDAERILDAPDLLNDYYLNLVDWSCNNHLAVALGAHVYIWNRISGSITPLLSLGGRSPRYCSWSKCLYLECNQWKYNTPALNGR